MAAEIGRGQIWMLGLRAPDKRRPVLVLSRDALIRALNTVTVAAITSTLRGSPTEVALGIDEGMKRPSCANLANVFTAPKAALHQFVATVEPAKMRNVCGALAVAFSCE